jgi:hypothetical protein
MQLRNGFGRILLKPRRLLILLRRIAIILRGIAILLRRILNFLRALHLALLHLLLYTRSHLRIRICFTSSPDGMNAVISSTS